ncbi:MAG: hypothetical protein K2X50_00655 [Gammaproteobacteria bacterium]|nr:hypothetical protein [Gammaproteobacteria bacterium]
MKLIKNKIYTSQYLKDMYGGNFRCSMPLVNGIVEYCKFDPKINLNFPAEAWIEVGPLRRKSAVSLLRSKIKIPIFEKISTNQWKFIGKARISDGTTNEALKYINKNPPREEVQFILKFSI